VRRAIRGLPAVLIGVAALAADPAAAQPAGANYDESKVPAYTLPDPLRFVDGAPVVDPGAWTRRRRAEILRLFEAHVYGRSPGPSTGMRVAVVEAEPRSLNGLATRRQLRVLLDGTDTGPAFDILLYVPNAPRTGPGAPTHLRGRSSASSTGATPSARSTTAISSPIIPTGGRTVCAPGSAPG
jgi:hypothetical protein